MTSPSDGYAQLLTEQRNPRSTHIDKMSSREIVQLIHQEDHHILPAIETQLDTIANVVDAITNAFRKNGRLIYVGAGTSGRLGVLDAAECPPTFRADPTMVQGIIAGGWDALRRSIEGAEDYPDDGAQAIIERNVSANDVVVGIAASSTTPFVIGALQEARKRGAITAFITCTQNQDKQPPVDHKITLLVGPEIVTGSTRLKAGTATKMVLNMLTTASMIRIGKVYENLMVDLNVTCNKLQNRAERIISTLTNLDQADAKALLKKAGGKVKTALVMYFCEIDQASAEAWIAKKDGRIQDIISPE